MYTPPPIKFTIENISGVYKYSSIQEINDNISLIRIMAMDHKESPEKTDLAKVVKKRFLNKLAIIGNYHSAYGNPRSILEIPIEAFIKSNADFTLELIEDSKVEVILFLKQTYE